MRYEGSKKLPEPIDELIEKLKQPLNTRTLCDTLIPFLRIMDFKTQVAYDRSVTNEKVLNSLDDCVYDMSEEAAELQDVLRKQFFQKPNPNNDIEQSQEYIQREGLNVRPRDPVDLELEVGEQVEGVFTFETAEDLLNFKEAMEALTRITTHVDPELVYASLFLE